MAREAKLVYSLSYLSPIWFNSDDSDNSGTMALDGGVDLNFNKSIGARVSVGYMRFFADPGTNGLRVNIGVVVPF